MLFRSFLYKVLRARALPKTPAPIYVTPRLKGVKETSPKTYSFFHLRMTLIDRFNRSFDYIRPFLAVNRDPRDSQVLLGRPMLKDFGIIIQNG